VTNPFILPFSKNIVFVCWFIVRNHRTEHDLYSGYNGKVLGPVMRPISKQFRTHYPIPFPIMFYTKNNLLGAYWLVDTDPHSRSFWVYNLV